MPRRALPTTCASGSRVHVSCRPTCSLSRYFGLFILGGVSAFVLTSLLCLPLSSSSSCNSTPEIPRTLITSLFTRKSFEKKSCFTEGNCVTTADSAAILSFHLGHVKFMVSLVEGTGLPPGRYFDFESSLLRHTGKYAIYRNSEVDEDRKIFVDNLHTLCGFRHKIKDRYRLYLVNQFFQSFGPWGMSPVLDPFEVAIKSLKRAAEEEVLMQAASLRFREKRAIKVDNMLRPSLDRFFADTRVAFTKLSAGAPPILDFFANISSYGRLVSEGLDTEIPRVAEAYRNLPWWDSVPILESITESIFGIKPRRWAITSYKEFLSRDEASIRTVVEHASISHDHFAALARYWVWYTNHPVMYYYNSTEKPPTADELAQSVEGVKARLDHDYYGDNLDIPPRRMIGSHLSLPFHEETFVEESVDSDGDHSA